MNNNVEKKEKKKGRGKKSLAIILTALLVIACIVGVLVKKGMNGYGTLSFLSYLTNPAPLAETQYEVETQAIEVENDGETIKGYVYIPDDGKETREVLIFSHGFNCQSQLLENKAKALAASGIATVIYDFRGGSTKGQSEGDTVNMTVETEKSDLNLIIDTVKEYEWVNTNRIFLMGESFGGLITALVAPTRSDINSIILCFPALMSGDSARENFDSVDAIPDTVDVGDMTTGKEYWAQLYNLDVYKEISGFTGKVLILHGTEDPNVPISYSEKANELYINSTLVEIEGAEHCFGGDNAKTAYKTVYNFIKSKG